MKEGRAPCGLFHVQYCGMADANIKQKGIYLEASIMRHIVVMTAAWATALFASDLINIFYLSRLGQVEISAAVGYAATFFFFVLIAVGIDLAIAAVDLVAPALGAGDRVRANRFA